MSKKPTVLMILDGYGLNDNCQHNAVCEGKTPVMDQLMSQCPFVKGEASGMAVGLPEGQMGNSEVGHLNMGAGRIVYQELTRITKSIQDGDFFQIPEFLTAIENCKKHDSALHMFGLVSDGGVHSHNTHIYGLLELAKKNGLKKVYVHCFLDGRDTPPESGKGFVEQLEAKMKELLTDTQIDEGRIVAEVVIFADKICTDEEVVRLRSHIEHMKQTLEEAEGIGRKLDFIAQEMNREANTILSKANNLEISNRAIDLKTEIE